MKIKTFIFLFIIAICVFYIYSLNMDKKIYYVNITDYQDANIQKNIKKILAKDNKLEKYINIYSNNNYRVTDIIRDINDNIEIKNKKIQNILVKADMITISVGHIELDYKKNCNDEDEYYEYLDYLVKDIDDLLKKIRIFSKEKIFLLGYKFNEKNKNAKMIKYINIRLKNISKKNKVIYIDINKTSKKEIEKQIIKSTCNNKN